MTVSKLLTEQSNRGVATFTLNRPEVGNACDLETLALLNDALARANAATAVRVIVLCGAGSHFCAGLDVRASQHDATQPSGATFPSVCRLLDSVSKPTVAVVQGGCAGGGVALVACCDVVLAADDAFFSLPEVRIGLAPGPLALYAARSLGVRGMRRYLLTGERFTAKTAKRLGLVHDTRPVAELEAALADIVEALLLGAPGAQKHAKAILAEYDAARVTDAAFDVLQAAFRKHAATDEAREGRLSFHEKRKPAWYRPANDDSEPG